MSSANTKPPRYEEIAAYLRGLVATAAPDGKLPSDAELCARFGVSRMTARHAVELLSAEGLLYRHRGRGTFVAPRPVPRLLGSPLSFTESMRRRGLDASSRIVFAGPAEPDAADVAALRLGHGDRVVVVERVRLAGGVPMAIERAVLAPDLGPVLDSDLEGGSLHAALERLGRIPTRAKARVAARPASARERRLLELDAPGVLLCESRVIDDQNGVPLEHTETRYAAQRYTFEAVLYRDGTETIE